jgi:hypothetical protein
VNELREGIQPSDAPSSVAQEQPEPSETTEQPRAETMTREEYADHMRQQPAAEVGEYDTAQASTDTAWQEQGEHAQGMSRDEYADHMRQGPAAGGNEADEPEAPEVALPVTADQAERDWHTASEGESDRASPTERHDNTTHGEQVCSDDGARAASGGPEARYDAKQTSLSDALSGEGDQPFPTAAEREHGRSVYQQWRSEIGTGRDGGINVVGEKPIRSPSDISELPPAGEKLLEADESEKSRAERFGRGIERDFGDVADSLGQEASSVQDILKQPPTGHPEVAVPVHGPVTAPWSVQYGTPDAGSVAELGLVLGLLSKHAYDSIGRKMNDLRGRKLCQSLMRR